MTANKVLVVGGGVAGLTAASELADMDIDVEIVELSDFLGGHAIQYTCKATDQCVKCGACMVEEKLDRAVQHPKIAEVKMAVERLGLKHELASEAGYPKVPWRKTGVIMVERKGSKEQVIRRIAKQLLKMRSEN